MTKLVKFCKAEHNLANNCRTVQFGSFEYYREWDKTSNISDREEGQETTYVKHASSSPGCSLDLSDVNVGEFGNFVTISESTFVCREPNAAIFCCAELEDGIEPTREMANEFDPQYDSWFEIPNRRRFGAFLRNLIEINWSDEFLSPVVAPSALIGSTSESNCSDTLAITCIQGSVRYVAQKQHFVDGDNVAKFAEDLPAFARRCFTKPKPRHPFSEWRFVFQVLTSEDVVLSIRRDPLKIPIVPI